MENSIRRYSSDPPTGRLEADINHPKFAQYRYRRSPQADIGSDEPAPLFLSGDQDGYEPEDPPTPKRTITPSRIVTALFVASAVAMVVTLFSGDVARSILVNAKASLAGTWSAGATPAQLNVTPTTTSAPSAPRESQSASSDQPSRDDISAAYQAAIKSQVVAREPPAVQPPPPPARRFDPDELAALLKRARGLLAIGDIVSARLLLERAADAQEAGAALLLARTYDPEVLGTPDARSITPDPAKARQWYRKAAELGSSDAQQRLAQMQD